MALISTPVPPPGWLQRQSGLYAVSRYADEVAAEERIENPREERVVVEEAPGLVAYRFHVPPLFDAAAVPLEKDPAHHGGITPNSRREAVIGERLEQVGLLHGVQREETGAAEFVDAEGRKWDVKGFHSEFPPEHGGFVLKTALAKLEHQFEGGENVILDTQHLSAEHQDALRGALHERGWDDKVIWFRG